MDLRFCNPSINPIEVQFGNKYARVKISATSSDGKQVHAQVPRLATKGHLTAFNSSGGSSIGLTGDFTVRSHRNTHGFKFKNFSISGITYGDLTEAFGEEQTWVSVTIDPCAPLPFVPSCPIVTFSLFPNPLGLIILGIVSASLDAACYGIS